MSNPFSDLVWVMMDLDLPEGKTIVSAHERERAAIDKAAAKVGNRSYASAGDCRLFGPGTGETTVMVRQMPRAWLPEGITVTA